MCGFILLYIVSGTWHEIVQVCNIFNGVEKSSNNKSWKDVIGRLGFLPGSSLSSPTFSLSFRIVLSHAVILVILMLLTFFRNEGGTFSLRFEIDPGPVLHIFLVTVSHYFVLLGLLPEITLTNGNLSLSKHKVVLNDPDYTGPYVFCSRYIPIIIT